jgi:hypothetical protein
LKEKEEFTSLRRGGLLCGERSYDRCVGEDEMFKAVTFYLSVFPSLFSLSLSALRSLSRQGTSRGLVPLQIELRGLGGGIL